MPPSTLSYKGRVDGSGNVTNGKYVIPQLNWNFDNSYARLPSDFYSKLAPKKVDQPQLVILNRALVQELGLVDSIDDVDALDNQALAQLFSGTRLPQGAEPLAQAYAGHQFGHFTMLGDGRAHLLGEHITPDGRRVDIQFKGSGPTPYSRRGDGCAALAPMLREYVISEAMHALGIASCRSLAVVTTGKPVYRESALPGAVLTRVAASHLRVGTFEYTAAKDDKAHLKELADYTIDRHYPELKDATSPYAELLAVLQSRQIELVIDWLRVGFIHGVMNTDNMTISGETIDYGPCAFMNSYDPETVFSSIDQNGRYAFGNQPAIVQWNLICFATAILPLLHSNNEEAVTKAQDIINEFQPKFQHAWLQMMRAKLGLLSEEKKDGTLIQDFLEWMQQNKADYTNTFLDLMQENLPDKAIYHTPTFTTWHQRWNERLSRNKEQRPAALKLMRNNNPSVIPRNHRVEEALEEAQEHANFKPLQQLLEALASPYQTDDKHAHFQTPPPLNDKAYQTFCGT